VTVWRYSISWSKFDLADKCPLALQNTIDKKPPDHEKPNYYMVKGSLVQKVFELWFNQRVNQRPGGDDPRVLQRVIDRLIASPYYNQLNTTYPAGTTEEDLIKNVRTEVAKGLAIFRTKNLTKKLVRSEVKWNSVFRGFRMFGMFDFYTYVTGGVAVYDGKGHAKKNANPDQIRYYALQLIASGKKVRDAGLIYWNHGYEPVNVSPAAIRAFIDAKLDKVRPIFEKLKSGVEELPATPSDEVCEYCSWKYSCLFSTKRRPEVPNPIIEDVGFREVEV